MYKLTKLLLIFFTLILILMQGLNAQEIEGKKWVPGHYLTYKWESKSSLDNPNSDLMRAINNPNIDGITVTANWRYLEPTEGDFNWEEIDEWVNAVSSNEKAIIFKVFERTFKAKDPEVVLTEEPIRTHVVPNYINDMGCVFQKRAPDISTPQGGDYVFKGEQFGFWIPRCNEKYINAVISIGKRYNDNPYFIGFYGGETAIATQGFYNTTKGNMRNGYHDILGTFADELPNQVYLMGMNHWGKIDPLFPGLDASERALNRFTTDIIGFESGGIISPDLCTSKSDLIAAYNIYRNRSSEIAVVPQTQRGGCGINLVGKQSEMADFAINDLNANIIVWLGRIDFTNDYDALMLATSQYETIQDCPTSFSKGCLTPQEFKDKLDICRETGDCSSSGGGSSGGENPPADPPENPQPSGNFETCHKYSSGSSIDFRYAMPRHPITRELLFTSECSSNELKVKVNAPTDTLVYNKGYIYKNNNWEEIDLIGNRVGTSTWLKGVVTSTISNVDTSQEGYVLTYMCHWHADKWKCGCRDRICSQSKWNVQAFQN